MTKKKYTKFEFQINNHEEETFNPSVTQSNKVAVVIIFFFAFLTIFYTQINIALHYGKNSEWKFTFVVLIYYF